MVPHRLPAALLVCFGLCWAPALAAQGPTGEAPAMDRQAEQRARSISGAVLSPFCPGRTLDDCPSPYAAAWRKDIRRWVHEGASGVEIRKRLEARMPAFDFSGRPSGQFHWLLPVGVLVVSLTLLWLAKRRLLGRSGGREPKASDPELDARFDGAVEAELLALED